MIKSRRMHKMLLPVIIAVMMGCTSIQMSPDKPQAGESIKITMKEELKDPLVEVVFLKDNLDFDFDVVTPRKEKDRWVITINSDTLTSYVIWRIVDQDAIYFPGGEGVIFYKGDKPQHLAYYYCGLHKEKAIPYALDVDEKEQKKIINAAIKCYDKELKFYPGEPMAFGRKKSWNTSNLMMREKRQNISTILKKLLILCSNPETCSQPFQLLTLRTSSPSQKLTTTSNTSQSDLISPGLWT